MYSTRRSGVLRSFQKRDEKVFMSYFVFQKTNSLFAKCLPARRYKCSKSLFAKKQTSPYFHSFKQMCNVRYLSCKVYASTCYFIYCGASRSFASLAFSKNFSIVMGTMEQPLVVEITDHQEIRVSQVFKDYTLEILNVKFPLISFLSIQEKSM